MAIPLEHAPAIADVTDRTVEDTAKKVESVSSRREAVAAVVAATFVSPYWRC
ncbi:MAG: hypothetical protein WA860_10135 [Acidimicrobiales bacterium]|jgi:hypothetical protein